jgi:hypothetical protein
MSAHVSYLGNNWNNNIVHHYYRTPTLKLEEDDELCLSSYSTIAKKKEPKKMMTSSMTTPHHSFFWKKFRMMTSRCVACRCYMCKPSNLKLQAFIWSLSSFIAAKKNIKEWSWPTHLFVVIFFLQKNYDNE